jgi:hypothetical protein
MLYCYFTDSPFETVRLMANYLTISILTLLDTQLSRHVDLPKSKALLRHIKWTLREMLHVLFYASTLRQQIINCTGCLTRHARYIQSQPNTKMLEMHNFAVFNIVRLVEVNHNGYGSFLLLILNCD